MVRSAENVNSTAMGGSLYAKYFLAGSTFHSFTDAASDYNGVDVLWGGYV